MKVAIIMGSTSDLEVMEPAIRTLEQFGVETEKRIISAHRTPDLMCEFAKTARERGIGVIIAGAFGKITTSLVNDRRSRRNDDRTGNRSSHPHPGPRRP